MKRSAKIKEMIKQGYTAPQIARSLGVTRQAVYRYHPPKRVYRQELPQTENDKILSVIGFRVTPNFKFLIHIDTGRRFYLWALENEHPGSISGLMADPVVWLHRYGRRLAKHEIK